MPEETPQLSERAKEAQSTYKAFMRLGWGVTALYVLMFAGLVLYFS